MFSKGKHLSANSAILNILTNKKLLLGMLAITIVAILIPTISFATEVVNAEGESLPEKVENAITEIIAEAPAPPAAPSEDMSNYLCFEPAEPGTSVTFSFKKVGNPKGINTVYYSDDEGANWDELLIGQEITINSSIYIKSYNPTGFNSDWDNYYRFNIQGDNKIKASGSVMSLIDNGTGTMFSIADIPHCFESLFHDCNALVTPPKLPATTLSYACYSGMFHYCYNLTTAPELPALEVCDYSYYNMFGLSSIKEPPVLPATKLGEWCYSDMFIGSDLIIAPELPATNLNIGCYYSMFQNCYDLTASPYLPSTTLVEDCYYYMFQNCSSLKKVSVGFTSWGASSDECTTDWLESVPDTSDGIFQCPKSLEIIRDKSHIPSNWQVQYFVSANVEGYNNVYDGQEHGITITPQDPAEITKEYSWDGSSWSTEPITEKNVGEYKVYYKLSAENYLSVEGSAMIVITPITDAGASFVGAPYSKMYGDADPNFEINFVGLVSGFTPKLYEDYTIIREIGEDVTADGASHKVTFNWINPNYSIAPMETTLTITKTNKYKLVCDNVSKVDYEGVPTFTAHMEGLKFDDVLLSTDYKIKQVPGNDNPSVITLTPSFSDDVSDRIKNNYVIDDTTCFVNGTYKIYESPETSEFQFAIGTYDSYYDGQNHEFKINVKSPASGATVQYKKEGDTDWRYDPYSFKDVGEYKITYKITHEGFADVQDSATLNIQKAPATVVPNACSKIEGEADPALTAKVYGLVEGESLDPGIDYILERQPGEAPGTYPIYCRPGDSATANNYELIGADSKFFIASAGGNAENVEGGGASGAKTGDANAAIFITIAIIGLASAGYVLYRRYRKN